MDNESAQAAIEYLNRAPFSSETLTAVADLLLVLQACIGGARFTIYPAGQDRWGVELDSNGVSLSAECNSVAEALRCVGHELDPERGCCPTRSTEN